MEVLTLGLGCMRMNFARDWAGDEQPPRTPAPTFGRPFRAASHPNGPHSQWATPAGEHDMKNPGSLDITRRE